MKEDEAIIEQYRVDTKKVQQKINDLRSGAVTFQVISIFSKWNLFVFCNGATRKVLTRKNLNLKIGLNIGPDSSCRGRA